MTNEYFNSESRNSRGDKSLFARGAAMILSCSLGLAFFASQANAGVLKIELPPEIGSFKNVAGSEMANGQCLTCHSVEYVLMQPPLPRAFWAAEVKKMRDKFGAVIPDDQVDPIVNFLNVNFGAPNQPAVVSTNATPAPVPTPAPAPTVDAASLVTRYGCLGCHNVNIKIVGPAYKDVAAKYHGDAQAFDKIAEQIHHGGSGKWGPAIMPPFPMVTDAEIKVLAGWIMKQDPANSK